LRQLTNAESDAPDDFVVVVVVFEFEDVEEVAALPQAARSEPAKATPTIPTEIVRNFDFLNKEAFSFPMGTSMKTKSGRPLMTR